MQIENIFQMSVQDLIDLMCAQSWGSANLEFTFLHEEKSYNFLCTIEEVEEEQV
jgi:hypothetical protein